MAPTVDGHKNFQNWWRSVWSVPKILSFLRMRFFNFFLSYMVQKYQNKIAPIFYYGMSTKTNEKDLKIPSLQPSDWKNPYWMSLYVPNIHIHIQGTLGPGIVTLPSLGAHWQSTDQHNTGIMANSVWSYCSQYVFKWVGQKIFVHFFTICVNFS